MTERQIPYVLAVKPSTTAYPADAVTVMHHPRRGPQPSAARYLVAPSSLKELVVQAGRSGLRQVTWRHGTKTTPDNRVASMTSRFIALRVCPANRDIARADDGSLSAEWLLAEWPAGSTAPTDYWLSTLPEDTPVKELVRLGLAHFEGRAYAGWHHHMTLVTAAHLFITTLRLTRPKAVGAA